MKNPFTLLNNKFLDTFESTRSKLFRQKQKDAGTKKETGRSKSGSSSSVEQKVSNDDVATNAYSSAIRKQIAKRRLKNKMARKSRRINRLRRAA